MTLINLAAILTATVALAVPAHAAAEDCTMHGRVLTTDGAPAPSVPVSIVRGRFRLQAQQVTTATDGTFSVDPTPCAAYTVYVGIAQPVKINVRKQPTFILTISPSAAESARRVQERQIVLSTPLPSAVTDADRADERSAAEYRERFIATLGPEAQRAFAASTTPRMKAQTFATLVMQHMKGDISAAPPRSQSSSRRSGHTTEITEDTITEQLSEVYRARVTDLVTAMLSPGHGERLAAVSPRERTRMVITAARATIRQMQWPSATTLVLTDFNNGMNGRELVKDTFGEGGELRDWDLTGNPRARGDLVRRALGALAEAAAAFLEDRPTSPALTRLFRSANGTGGSEIAEEKRSVMLVFGRDVADTYEAMSITDRAELRRLAAISSVAFSLVPERSR